MRSCSVRPLITSRLSVSVYTTHYGDAELVADFNVFIYGRIAAEVGAEGGYLSNLRSAGQ